MQIQKKLRSRRGESIAEVLLAVMVGALAIALFTVMLSSSAKIIMKNRTAMQEYVAGSNALVRNQASAQYDVSAHPYSPAAEDCMTVTLQGVFTNGSDAVPADYCVQHYNNLDITLYSRAS